MAKILTVADGDYIQLPWGMLIFHNNELHIKSDVNDAAGFSIIGPNGKLSFKTQDGVERMLLEPRVNAAGDGELYVGCLDQQRFTEETAKGNTKAGDTAMIEVAVINSKGVEFRVPIKASAGVIGRALGVDGRVTRFYSDDGRFCFNVQGDEGGHIVQYDMHGSDDPLNWTAVAQWKGLV